MTHPSDGESAVTEKRTNWTMRILFAVLALAVVAVIVFSLFQMNTGDDPVGESRGSTGDETADPTAPEPTSTDDESDQDMQPSDSPVNSTHVLEESLSGQEAIDALGDDIDIVAEKNNMSVDELKEFLLRNESAVVRPDGFIFLP